jgi:hypothetical protein
MIRVFGHGFINIALGNGLIMIMLPPLFLPVSFWHFGWPLPRFSIGERFLLGFDLWHL